MQVRKISLQDSQQNIVVLELYDILTNSIFNEQSVTNLNQSISNLNFDAQLRKILETQSSRPQTAFVQKQTSVQTLERMSKLNKKSFNPRPQSSIYSYHESEEQKPTKLLFQKQQLQYEEQVDLVNSIQPQTQRSQASQAAQPIDSQFAMSLKIKNEFFRSLNFGGANLEGVLKLLQNKSPEKLDVGVIQAQGRKTLRPQTAVKKKEYQTNNIKRDQSEKRGGSANAYSDQQNLKQMKKINGMTNYIVMKGTSALNDDFK